ncbi:MAG: 16S rRNA (guanine(527)-N(7))-methyltransferase RsmG [Bacteroidales bacterium]|nr:16S rRNA (guanine(527)-N(7))-methyltransferase RsmG [Bacteroidales bacterium]
MINDKSYYEGAVALWREWNGKINVISRKDDDCIYEHHILHSLAIARYFELFYPSMSFEGASFLDLGTGGGFPGIPLAINYPGARFVLCDSIGKKVKVARAVADGLALGNVECVNARAESIEGPFDWVVSRAVAPLDRLYPWVKGRFGRSIICLKGGDIASETALLMHRFHVDGRKIRSWRISDWLDDEYFKEKFVIEVGKDYLCPPVFE